MIHEDRFPDASSTPAVPAVHMVPSSRPSTWRHFLVLLRKDLRREFRTREMLTSMGLYALLVIIVFGAALALTARGIDIASMGGGLIWVPIVFTSLLGLGRSFAYEKDQGCVEGVLLVPMDRSVIFLAKATANALFLAVVEIIAIPLFYFFFMTGTDASSDFPWIIVPLVLGTIGIAGIGTMLSTITMHTRSADVLLAVLFIPIIFPLLYACTTATTAAIVGTVAWTDYFVIPLVIAAGFDIIMLLVCWVLYDFVISS